MTMQRHCVDANQALKDFPVGGYSHIYWLPRSKEPLVGLDGDFDMDDLRRLLGYLETIVEDAQK